MHVHPALISKTLTVSDHTVVRHTIVSDDAVLCLNPTLPASFTDNAHGRACTHAHTHAQRCMLSGITGLKSTCNTFCVVNTSHTTNDWTKKMLYASPQIKQTSLMTNRKITPSRFVISGDCCRSVVFCLFDWLFLESVVFLCDWETTENMCVYAHARVCVCYTQSGR